MVALVHIYNLLSAQKKKQTNIFYVLHSSVSDLKSVKALSSRAGGSLYRSRGALPSLPPPVYALDPAVFLKAIFEVRSRAQKYLAANGGHFE